MSTATQTSNKRQRARAPAQQSPAQADAPVERDTKRQKPAATRSRVLLVDQFHMTDAKFQPIVKSTKCNLVPLSCDQAAQNPVLVQLSGGGVIPLSFGIEDKETDGRRKVQVAFQIDSLSDHGHLVRLRGELGSMVAGKWSEWFPDTKKPSDEVILNFCNNFVSDRKKKKNSEDTWSGVAKAAIDPKDCASGRCKIVDNETGETVSFEELPGMKWHKAILEFRYVYIQATKSYGVTKKLRYLSCSRAEEDGEIIPL